MVQFRRAMSLLLLLALPGLAIAAGQQQPNSSSISSFFNDSASFIYNLAWPTAKYSTYRLTGIEPVPGGVDVKILLDGRSGFDNSDLWLLLLVKIRKNGIDDIKVLDDNHFLVAPFQTSIALGQAAAEVGRRYEESQQLATNRPTQSPQQSPTTNSSEPVVSQAVCLENPTDMTIPLLYRWGDREWISDSLGPGMTRVYYWTAATSPVFLVRYDADLAEGLQLKTYELARRTAGGNPTCAVSQRYKFSLQGSGIEVYAN